MNPSKQAEIIPAFWNPWERSLISVRFIWPSFQECTHDVSIQKNPRFFLAPETLMANFDTGFQAVEGEIFLSSVFHCFLLTRNSGKLLLEEQAVGAQQEVAPTRQQQLFSLVLLRLRPHCYRWRIDDASSSPETPLLRHPNIPQHMVARKKKKKQKTLNSLPLAAAAKIHKSAAFGPANKEEI